MRNVLQYNDCAAGGQSYESYANLRKQERNSVVIFEVVVLFYPPL